MFAHSYFAPSYFAPVYFPPIVAAVTSTGSRGRRLVRYIISAPTIENPVGEWIRQRDDEEILFLG